MNKKIFLLLLVLFLLLCRFLYPHTRFGFREEILITSRQRLNIHEATLKPGEKIKVELVSIKKTAHYSTSDFRIAAVTPFGTVHALKPGTAIISVRQGNETYKCKITVIAEKPEKQ